MGDLLDGRYSVVRLVGEGAMGRVLAARDVHLERTVAVKVLRAHAGPRSRRMFEREARALASVNHPGVPTIFSFGVHHAHPFFTMELVAGESLSQIIGMHAMHGAVIPLHRGLSLFDRIASALSAAHAAGVLHRDVKPENVLIEGETGRPVLVDFGIAAELGGGAETVGTPAFMAPEIWLNAPPTIASDVYALGCLAFELLTGQPAFDEIELPRLAQRHQGEERPRPSDFAPQLRHLDSVIERALAVRPEDRFQTCAAMRAAFNLAASEERAPSSSILPPSDALRVLVIDDDPVFGRIARRAAKVAFADSKVDITRAKDAEEGLREAQRWMPQLLLLDYNMPGLNGAEMLSRVRAMPGGEAVSVIVMSGEIDEEQRWRFSSLGVRDYVEKPTDFDRFVRTIVRKGQARGWLPRVIAERSTEDDPT